MQRLAIALYRGTYVRPHVHSAQWEMLILLRGAADVLFFTPAGELMGRTTLAQDRVGVIQIPQGQVHGAVALQDDTAVIEVKPGPYRANEYMNWAPAEGFGGYRRVPELVGGRRDRHKLAGGGRLEQLQAGR